MQELDYLEDDAWGTVFRDVVLLALVGFVAMVILLLPHITEAKKETDETSVPGNPSGVSQAFGWNSGDQNVDYWIPQGLTGSADASASGLVGGREVVLASWYYDADIERAGEILGQSTELYGSPSDVGMHHLQPKVLRESGHLLQVFLAIRSRPKGRSARLCCGLLMVKRC